MIFFMHRYLPLSGSLDKVKMKVYAAALLLAAYVSAKELPDEVTIPDLDDDVKELTEEEINRKYWDSVK